MGDLGEYKPKQHPPAEQEEGAGGAAVYWRTARAVRSLFCPHCYHSYGAALVPTGGIKVGHILTFTALLHPFPSTKSAGSRETCSQAEESCKRRLRRVIFKWFLTATPSVIITVSHQHLEKAEKRKSLPHIVQ